MRPALEPLLAKRGMAQASLVLDWQTIAGARFGALCEPAKLQWPRRGPLSDPSRSEPAILWLRVAPGRALDIQYAAPVLIERVNAHFGWRCVSQVKIAPQAKRAPIRTQVVPPPDARAQERAAAATSSVTDASLRAALTQLGAGVFTARRR